MHLYKLETATVFFFHTDSICIKGLHPSLMQRPSILFQSAPREYALIIYMGSNAVIQGDHEK